MRRTNETGLKEPKVSQWGAQYHFRRMSWLKFKGYRPLGIKWTVRNGSYY